VNYPQEIHPYADILRLSYSDIRFIKRRRNAATGVAIERTDSFPGKMDISIKEGNNGK
jgi:hypothetical protein